MLTIVKVNYVFIQPAPGSYYTQTFKKKGGKRLYVEVLDTVHNFCLYFKSTYQ